MFMGHTKSQDQESLAPQHGKQKIGHESLMTTEN